MIAFWIIYELNKAGDGNRTRISCLEGKRTTIVLHPQIDNEFYLILPDFSKKPPRNCGAVFLLN